MHYFSETYGGQPIILENCGFVWIHLLKLADILGR